MLPVTIQGYSSKRGQTSPRRSLGGTQICVALLIFWQLAASTIFILTSGWKFHVLYRPDVPKLLEIRRNRRKNARAWISNHSIDEKIDNSFLYAAANSHTKPSVCIGFMAVNDRPGLPIIEAVYSLLHRIQKQSHGDIFTVVQEVFRDKDNTISSAMELENNDWKDHEAKQVLENAGFRVTSLGQCPEDNPNCSSQEQEYFHYSSALKTCLDTNADNIVIVEEDAWATSNFITKLYNAIEKVKIQLSNSDNLWILKVFVSSFWSGWERNFQTVFELGVFGVLGFIIGCSSSYYIRPKFSKYQLFVLGMFVAILVPVVVYSIGRQNFPLDKLTRRGVFPHDIGASSVGNAYSRETATKLLLHLQSTNPWHQKGLDPPEEMHIDSSISAWRKESGFQQYVVIPCLVEHTGLFTIVSDKIESQADNDIEERFRYTKTASIFED